MTIEVALIAPVRAYLDALASALGAMPGIDVVGQATTIVEGMSWLAARKPSVTLFDFGFDDVVSAVTSLRLIAPTTRLVAIGIGSSPEQSEAVVRAAQTGVSGFVDSDRPIADIVDAVKLAARGLSPCSPRIVSLLLQVIQRRPELAWKAPHHPEQRQPLSPLTPREQLVSELAARGMTNRQIASHLRVGETTVKTHMHAVLRKLDLTSRDQLIVVARSARPGG